ncbi:MAG: polynucleotide adenylyltransferase PcnB [Treponema sp.]|nr:polynucleotide adenylyltransferase PcnB [Treponema sp.]
MRYRYSTDKNGKPRKTAAVYTKKEHGIDLADIDDEASGVVRRLRDAGFEAYLVGGAVRDLILRKKPKDFDIASEASPMQIRRLFRNSRIIGRRFKLVHVYFGQRIYEVSTFRSLKDGMTGNTFGTIEEDVRRRDFTMNALFYDPIQEVVVDYVGGMQDIREGRVRPIIPLSTIFKDDPVRMIRAVKYAATAGFALPLRLRWKIKSQSPLLVEVSGSRLTEEIFKIVHSSCAAGIVDALDGLGLYAYLQPAAAALMRQNPPFRVRYLRSLAALNGEGFKGRPGEALGALVNDFLEDSVDPEVGTSENYKAAYLGARNFILPMTPPRFELEHAVRRFFSARGIQLRKAMFQENPPPDRRPAGQEESPEGGEPTKKPRRRRRRKPQANPPG